MTKNSDYVASDLGQGTKELLEKQGFNFPEQPKYPVSIPADITEIAIADLMEHFAVMTAWCDYANAQVGLAAIAERDAQRTLDWREADVWHNLPKSSVTASKAHVALDTDVQDAMVALDEAYAYRRLVTDLANRYERDAAVLSRELTRRTSEQGPKASRRERWST
jgi:hypothetical protein